MQQSKLLQVSPYRTCPTLQIYNCIIDAYTAKKWQCIYSRIWNLNNVSTITCTQLLLLAAVRMFPFLHLLIKYWCECILLDHKSCMHWIRVIQFYFRQSRGLKHSVQKYAQASRVWGHAYSPRNFEIYRRTTSESESGGLSLLL